MKKCVGCKKECKKISAGWALSKCLVKIFVCSFEKLLNHFIIQFNFMKHWKKSQKQYFAFQVFA